MSKRKKLVIFDGHALLHRGFHALPFMSNREGTQTNAVYGFTMMMLLALRQIKPDYVVVAWDAPGKTFRHDQFKDYKGTRKEVDKDLVAQMPITKNVVEAFNIPLIEMPGYEADDIIGSLAHQHQSDLDVVIVTGDMDELQLVGPHTTVFTMRKGFSDTFEYDPAAVEEKYGVTPEEFVVYKALKGDTSDNIPGVAGIGDKTATQLVAEHKTLDNMYAHLDDIKPAVRKKLEDGRDNAYLSLELSKIKLDLKLKFNLRQAVIHEYDRKKVYDLFHKLEFKSLLSKLPPAEDITAAPAAATEIDEEQVDKFNREHIKNAKYEIVTNQAQLKGLIEKLNKSKVFAFDTETTNTDVIDAELVGLSFSVTPGEAYYVPVGHVHIETGRLEPDQHELDNVLKQLKPVLENNKIGKVGHNIKYDYEMLKKYDVHLGPIVFDTMVAAFLINPIGRAQTLSELAYAELGISMIEIEELIGKKGKGQLHFGQTQIEKAGLYAAEDADISLRLYQKMQPELKKIGKLDELAKLLEWPLIEVLGDMELTGVTLDVGFMKTFAKKIDADIDKCQKSIWKHAGKEFNINSTQQLKVILFDEIKIDTTGLKKTKTGVSTAASELEKMRGLHPIIDELFEYRELTKLKSTYVDALPQLVKPDGKIHTSYNQTISQTGRLSSTDPNLQNIPVRTPLGREIRKAFIAGPGNVFVSADYSQIELRLAAALANDKPMIADFKSGADIHTLTAAEMFGVKPDKVTKDMRYGAKTINFGVLYGMSPHGLSVATGFDYDQAREFIDRYFGLRKGVADYITRIKKMAHELEYTETAFGRRRPCPDVRSSNFIIRSAAERAAVNMPLQGTAADMMKLAMVRIYRKLPEKAKLILQIHDELIVECPEGIAKQVAKIMETEMINVKKFSVPIEVGINIGKSWGSME